MLTSGTRLGPYEIQALVGSGGMGEVYKARDVRLDRTVAVKVLSRQATDDPEFGDRLEREARAISQLNHPHICTLHDVGEAEGAGTPVRYFVMEFLEGETLAERLTRGPLPATEALQYATQIADALDRAHRTGIVHGDLKPANVMITRAGTKLLDFGLARQQPVSAGTGASDLPTRTMPVSRTATVLGTLHYLAPEQLEGHPADQRTDIFAFGLVLYEMLTGRKAFDGHSPASIIAAIIRDDPPPMTSVRSPLPPALVHTVTTCLAKDPDVRWQHAGDLKRALTWIAGTGAAGPPAPALVRVAGRAWLAVAALLLALGVVAALAWLRPPVPETPMYRTSVLLPEGLRFPVAGTVGGVGRFAISPDGRRVAFVATDPNGNRMLWVRPLESLTASPLPGTDGAASPFWSPDSRQIAFIAQGWLRRVDAGGATPPVTLASAFNTTGAWSRDHQILYTPSAGSALWAVPASGGQPRRVTTRDEEAGDVLHRSPFFLPDGRQFLYVAVSGRQGGATLARAVYVGSLDGTEPAREVLPTGTNAKYSDGHLIYLRDSVLVAHPFDTRRLALTGSPTPITEPVELIGSRSAAFSLSANGVLAYQPLAAQSTQLVWFDREGRQLGAVGEPGNYGDIELSPDGRRAAVSMLDPDSNTRDIWILDLERGVRTRFTFSRVSDEISPIWSPDGSRIVFASTRAGHFDLYQKSTSGVGVEELVYADNTEKYPHAWSPDGSTLLYSTFDGGGSLWLLPLDEGGREPERLASLVSAARFDPDGRWILYDSSESGRPESYVVPFPTASGRTQVSSEGGSVSRWGRGGREIFYVSRDNILMAVEVERVEGELRVGSPRPVLQARPVGPRTFYDVSPDGQRILLNTLRSETLSSMTLVQNWRAALAR